MQKRAERFYPTLAITAFGLNWIWEMAQMFAYQIKPEESRLRVFFFCTLASVVDAIVTAAVYTTLKSLLKLDGAKFYLAAAFSGAWFAVFFEWVARLFNLWSYNEKMPIIPFLEIGFLPLTQLTLLVPLAIWFAQKFKGK
ncbi:MAG TPA: hypothetical protein PKY59_20550 [Pyrinomonadaceae bacterium]|nr:hypothetical protein [Pyrinomonadaceae bacterium]